MMIAFEPIGDVFNLPSKEDLQLLVLDEVAGIDEFSMNIAVGSMNELPTITIFAERNKFEAWYKGQLVNNM